MKVLSLFNGMSVGRLALPDNVTYYSSEIEESSIKVTKENHDDVIELGDVTKWKEWPTEVFNIDLLIGGSPCFKAGTKVITNEGYKEIQRLELGELVLTHENRYRKVIDFGFSKKQIFNLKSQGSLEIETTENHPFYIKENRYSEPKWIKASDIKKGNFLSMNIIQKEENFLNLSEEDCWLLGRYIADGHYRKDKRKNRNDSYMYQVIISVGKGKEEEFKENIKNRHFSFYDHSQSVKRACFSSKELVELLEKIDIGKGALNKKIPKVLLDLPKSLLKKILDGYFSGDGSIKENKVKFNTVSKELALSLNLAVSKCYGTPVMLSKSKVKKQKEIQGRTVNQNDIYEGYFFLDHKKRRKNWFLEGDKIWLPFKNYKFTESEDFVYNITVEEDNSYTAENIIVHNCQGFSRQGIGLNFDDPRSKLFFEFVEILELIKSEYNPNIKFMLENVDMKKEWGDVITEHLGVKPIKINSDLLVPHNRPRTYWTNIDFELPINTSLKLIDILDDVMLMDYEEINGIKVCNSFNKASQDLLSVVDGEVRIKQPVKLGYAVADPGDGINISFPTSKTRRGRVVKGRSSCLDTSCDIGVYDQHGQIRRFTINELERLQGLPEGYTKSVSNSKAKQMLGNGWTLPVIKHILGGMKND